MAKNRSHELMQLDLYELLDLSLDSNESEIKKSYRKRALKCHPDKNPDNPDAAEEFDRLKKILEILLDPGARSAYDKVLKGRKAAALRAKATDARTQKLRKELEEREKKFQTHPTLTEEERFRRELKRLEEEGEQLIEEELRRLNQQIQDELRKDREAKIATEQPKSFKVKVKWRTTDDWPGYNAEEIRRLFYKWGEINDVAIKTKDKKGSALIDYKEHSGADMAVQFEKGQPGKPVEVQHIADKTKDQTKSEPISKKCPLATKRDFESVGEMNRRREEERRKLIEQMLQEEDTRI